MDLRVKLFIFWILFHWGDIVLGQQMAFQVRHFGIQEGISNDIVWELYQDSDGFIWCGTQYGLNKFDGKKFHLYNSKPSSPNSLFGNWVKSIEVIDNSQLLIGTHGKGLNLMDADKESFSLLYEENELLKVIHDTKVDKDKHLWLSGDNGSFWAQEIGSQPKLIQSSDSYKIKPQGDHIYIGSREGLLKFKSNGALVEKIISDRAVPDFHFLSQDSLLAFIEDNLELLVKDDGKWNIEFYGSSIKKTSDNPYHGFIYEDIVKNIWISGKDRIWKFDQSLRKREYFLFSKLLDNDGFKELYALDFLHDAEGNYWVGTNKGLFQLIPTKVFKHPVLEKVGIAFLNAREIIESKNNFWIVNSEGVWKWPKESDAIPQLVTHTIRQSLHAGKDGYIYTQEKKGDIFHIVRFKESNNEIEELDCDKMKVLGGDSWKIVEDKRERIWFSLWNRMICYDPEYGTCFNIFFNKNGSQMDLGIIDAMIDSNDALWVATLKEGLFRVDNISSIEDKDNLAYAQYVNSRNPNSITSNVVLSLHESADGAIWIGTDSGLNRYRDSTFTRYEKNVEMVDDKILTITSDSTGMIWMGTISHGILAFSPKVNKFYNFTESNGLYDNSMMVSSVLNDSKGKIWMGSHGGLHNFNPYDVLKQDSIKPNLIWRSMSLYEKTKTSTSSYPGRQNENITIHPSVNSIQFDFTTTTFKNPKEVLYRFFLKGYHNDWTPSQESGIISFSSLPPGSYNLKVEAFARDKSWTTSLPTIGIKLLPPWYKSSIAYFSYLAILSGFIYLFYSIQLRRKLAESQKLQLEELSRTKSRWFNQIAHEFKTPLTVIYGAIDRLRSKNEAAPKFIGQIENQANHLSTQVHNILEIARLQGGELPEIMVENNFIQYAKYLLDSFSSLAEEKGIELHFDTEVDRLILNYDEDKWNKIISNLISNAIKFTHPGGQIIMKIWKKDESDLSLMIQDNGEGIEEAFLPHVFEPFQQQLPADKRGTGIGLNLTSELVKIIKGEIKVNSKPGDGSAFTVTFPFVELESSEKSIIDLIQEDVDLPTVLIAEDHPEILEYIVYCLKGEYNVLTAKNGKEAWSKCLEHIPDLVISDIVMPEQTGIQLTKAIFQHKLTNHIPVILLSALSKKEDELRGIESGAVAYLKKPFQKEDLVLRVRNIISNSQKLQLKFREEFLNEPIKEEKIDGFVLSVLTIIKENMEDENFNVQALSDALFISRIQLYRKLKAIMGVTPTQYIRDIKLAKANEYLQNLSYNISEVAYKTGFKDPAYFSRVYYEKYGKRPSDVKK